MDQPEDKKIVAELDCQTWCSSDSENASNTENQSANLIPRDNWSKALKYDETSEDLDFEDDKRDTNSSTSPNCVQLKFSFTELNETSSMEKVTESSLNMSDMKTQTAGMSERKCNLDEMEEGEAIDDDENSVDMEDGEIEGQSKSNYTPKNACRFYQRGRCTWGNKCHYLHLSDKGLYNMLDSPVMSKCTFLQAGFVNKRNLFRPTPWEPARRLDSIWDRALTEAKERIKQSRMRKKEGFEEKLYMTVENDDRFIDEWEYSHDRHVLPKRQVCDFPSRCDNKPENLKNVSETVKPKLIRRTYGSKTDCTSGWRDPWRRSKTPPHRKRCLSKPLSNSSKSSGSRDNSSSSWTSRSCQSPSPKRSRLRSRTSHCKRSRSRSHRSLPRSSPCSCSASTFSCSGSSSAELSSTPVSFRKKERRMPSRSPVYRKRKSLIPERIVLPYKRRSRSIPRLVIPSKRRFHSVTRNRKTVQQDKPVMTGISRNIHTYNSRSRSLSSSSKSSTKLKPSGVGSCEVKSVVRDHGFSKKSHAYSSKSRSLSSSSKSSTHLEPSVAGSSPSCSNTSISPVSVRNPKRSGKEFRRESYLHDSGSSKQHMDIHRRFKVLQSDDVGILSRCRATNQKRIGQNNAPPVLDIKVGSKASKRINSLELELLKYGGNFTPSSKHTPSRATPQSLWKRAQLQNAKTAAGSASNEGKADVKNLSKRDLLMEQLKAVEEAIAKKKKLQVVRD